MNDGGTTYSAQTFAPSSASATPDAYGRIVFTLNPSATFNPIVLAAYTVDQNRIRLVETVDNFLGITSGVAYTQASSLVGKFASTNFEGNTYVTGMTGLDTFGFLDTVSQLTPASDGSVSGFIDFNDLSGTQTVSPDPIAAAASTVTVDTTGRVTIPAVSDGTTTFNLQMYLDGNGHALSITMDATDYLNGIGYQQTPGTYSAAALNNGLAFGFTGWDITNYDELDAVGTVNADGVGTTTGVADLNWIFSSAGTTGSGSTLVTDFQPMWMCP